MARVSRVASGPEGRVTWTPYSSGPDISWVRLRMPSCSLARRNSRPDRRSRSSVWQRTRRRPCGIRDLSPLRASSSGYRLDRIILPLEDVLHLVDVDFVIIEIHAYLTCGNIDAHLANTVDRLECVGNRALTVLARDIG